MRSVMAEFLELSAAQPCQIYLRDVCWPRDFPYREITLASRIGKLYGAGMRVIARKNLAAFWLVHPETEAPLRAWLAAANAADWESMTDVVATYSKVSPINAERCVFNVHGNSYRLIVAINFAKQIVFIKFIGTHSEYDNVDAATVSKF
jgi:mRNA interferase HigB